MRKVKLYDYVTVCSNCGEVICFHHIDDERLETGYILDGACKCGKDMLYEVEELYERKPITDEKDLALWADLGKDENYRQGYMYLELDLDHYFTHTGKPMFVLIMGKANLKPVA